MCGIAGILDRSGAQPVEVAAMADAIAHRGPDDATTHVEPGLGFGFRRLSIIDLMTGRQPIPNEDESVWVMLNGEIYNYRELRGNLEALGHRFRTRSDTEVIAHLYEEYGAGLVHHLRGMFGLAVWDRTKRRLVLARDHLGQKPLYWAERGDRLYFGSELKAILAAAPELRVVDPRALDEYLTLRIIADPRSMFRGVNKLPPAHVLIADPSGTRTERYWRLEYEPKRQLSEGDALAELDHHVRETVRLHLVSDVPVGAFLSGGLDSGLVVAMMAELAGESFKTFSIGVPYGDFNEADAARSVSARYGTEHYEEVVDGSLIETLPELVYYLDEPSDPLSACMYRLAPLARRHVKVALGGDGGDEIFGGYDRYYGAQYVRYYAALPRAIRRNVVGRILDRAPDGFWYKSFTHRLRWMNALADEEGGRRYARSLSYFYFAPAQKAELYTDRFRRQVAGFDAEEAIIRWHDDAGLNEALDRMLLADSCVRLPNHPVMIQDRMTMAHGLETRSPFLDHRLAEFMATMPARLKVRGSTRRYLQLRLAERYLPREVLQRPKQGFSSALPYMMADQFRALFAHFLPQSHLVGDGYLRAEPIERMLRDHVGGRTDHGNRLWLLLNAEVWYRMHIQGATVDELREDTLRALGSPSRGRTRSVTTV